MFQFMVGLAQQRHARKKAASVVNIGMIIGIGVIRRTEGDGGDGIMESSLRKQNYMPISERDLHHILAESIVAGKGQGDPEITAGLESYTTSPSAGVRPVWLNNPRFSHLVAEVTSAEAGDGAAGAAKQSLRQRLKDASGEAEASQIFGDKFAEYLAALLKLPLDGISQSTPVIDFGIDSLIAVEISNWVVTETGQDVPVLKLLGGSSIAHIANDLASSLCSSEVQETKAPSSPPVVVSSQPVQAATATTSTSVSLTPLRSLTPPADKTHGYDNGTSSISTPSPALSIKMNGSGPPIVRTQALSFGQSRIYVSSQYLDDPTTFNCTTSYTLNGDLDITRLRKSLDIVTRRHESFRSLFYTDSHTGEALQGVFQDPQFELKVTSGANDTDDLSTEFSNIHRYEFDLRVGRTFVATLLSHTATSHTIIFGYHHIIMDGVSWQLFLGDLSKFYNNPQPSATPPAQYGEFAANQLRGLTEGAYAERLRFFTKEIGNIPEPLPLFSFANVSSRKPLTRYAVRGIVTHVDPAVVSAVKSAAQSSRTTPFHFWLSTFQVLLCLMLDIEQVCIGIVDANRSDRKFASTIGFLLEIMPVLFNVRRGQSFKDILQATRGKTYGALAQSGVPIEEIAKACGVTSSAVQTPFFQVVFNYRMGATRTTPMDGVDIKFLDYADAKTPFDLAVSVDEMDDGTAMLTFSVQEYLYDQESAQLLADVYKHLLKELSADISAPVGDISLYDASMVETAVTLGTGPEANIASFGSDATLSQLVHRWTSEQSNNRAVKDMNGVELTYAGLHERVDSISAMLAQLGVGLESVVCVLLEPCVDTIASILAILRIGAVYVPLDVRSGDERLLDILQDSKGSILLHGTSTADRATRLSSQSSEALQLIDVVSTDSPTTQSVQDVSTLECTAMILYTSGTTGKPKGIRLTHENIRTTILGVSERASLGKEVMLQQSGQGFDAAVFQIFGALVNGGTLIMADNRGDPAELAATMVSEGVTCTLFIVSEMHSILQYGFKTLRKCVQWKTALVGGEVVTTNLLDKVRTLQLSHLRLFNAFGPTEASIITSAHEMNLAGTSGDQNPRVPIGRALANYGTYVVNSDRRPVPIGWPGEMAIAGPGVANGYIDRPELTEAKFVPDTVSIRGNKGVPGWERLYLTGDMCRMQADGSIVVSGRIDGDGQVKIRGMRVALDDIVDIILKSSSGNLIDAAVVVRGTDPSTQFLVSYVVFAGDKPRNEDARTYLRTLLASLQLPAHMRPVILLPMETLPVTERGKLDVAALSKLPLPAHSVNGDVDETEEDLSVQELRVRDVWRKVLGEVASAVPVKADSDFFAVGGNSLLLLRLRAEILGEFGEDVPLADLFQTSTIRLLAFRLSGTGSSQEERIDWGEETEPDAETFSAAAAQGASLINSTRPRKTDGLSVLLTGATGYLGFAILSRLVERPDVAEVHCAAVRGVSLKLNEVSPKVVVHRGDLTLPNLGLSDEELAPLFEQVDVIIHNGAEVSHMKNYRSLRAANVSSTVELARLALSHHISLHYVSTGGVASLSGLDSQPESSLAVYQPPSDGSGGYVASKWVSEVFLEKVNEGYGLPVCIHRPSNVTGPDVPSLDIVHSVLRFSRSMKSVPDMAGSTGAFDFIHLDTISANIVQRAVDTTGDEVPRTGTARGVSHIHQSGETVVPVDKLREHLGHTEHSPFKTLAMGDWVAQAKLEGLDEIVGSYLLASKGVIKMPLLENSISRQTSD